MKKALGKAFRKGLTLKQVTRKFPTDAAAMEWFVKWRWPDGIRCPSCGSNHVQTGAPHKTMPLRCRERGCRRRFSVKTGTLMERSKIGYQDWLLAIFLSCTHLKGVSSMKLHRDLGMTQKSAWFMLHRLRDAKQGGLAPFLGPAELDETYFGGKRRAMSKSTSKRNTLEGTRRGGKAVIVGAMGAPNRYWTQGMSFMPFPDKGRKPKSEADELREREIAPRLLEIKTKVILNPEASDNGRYRAVLTTIPRWLHSLSHPSREIALNSAPPLRGQPWDALLAAVCEHVAASHGHPMPPWCDEPSRFLAPAQFLCEDGWIMTDSMQRMPSAFVRHGAIPDLAELDVRVGEPYLWSPRTLREEFLSR